MTDAENETYFSAKYAEARTQFPLLSYPLFTHVDSSAVTTGELNVAGFPVFNIPPGFALPETDPTTYTVKHEAGHAFLRRLERTTSVPRSIYIEQFRVKFGYPTDYVVPGYSAGATSIEESWANAFCNVCEGRIVKTKSYLDEQIDLAVARAFFRALAGMPSESPTDYATAIWKPSPNYWPGRSFGPPQYIVDHWTYASKDSTITTFLNGNSTNPVAAHYLVCRDGSVIQFVREGDTAWHDGYDPDGYGPLPGWNHISIGIEHERAPWDVGWTEVQLAASTALHRDISARTGIPLVRDHVLGHNETGYATTCPGDLPIDTIIQEDDMFTDADRAKLQRVYDHVEAYESMIWTSRLQNWLSKALKSMPGYAKPTDFTGPDVITGQPRS